MQIKTRLYLTTFISIAGIIGIALFSLITILMVKERITVLTSQSTPLQVKTVQFQQAVEKLSADLLQLGLASDPQEVRQISASIKHGQEALEKLNKEISSLKNSSRDTAVFTSLHEQVLKATDQKFKSMALFKEEASRVNGAMLRVDRSLTGLKEIIAGLVSTASRRAATATKTLNETISEQSTVPDLIANVQNFRNEVDHDIELNRKINAINDMVYSIGVDAKLLDAKARSMMLSETAADLDRASGEVQAIQARIQRNLSLAAKGIREIKSTGFVDEAVAAISGAVGSAGASLRTIAASQRQVLESMRVVDDSVRKVKVVALEQGRKSEANVESTALEQQKFVDQVSRRVDLFKMLLIGISICIVVAALLMSLSTMLCITRSLKRMTQAFTHIAETGDFTCALEARSNDEFGVTIRAFNTLVQSFTGILATVSGSASRLAASSAGLNDTTREINTSVASQSASIQQVASASMEVSQTLSMISGNTERIREAVRETRDMATSGAEVVHRTGSEVEEIARAVMEATGTMKTLQERSKQVGEIVDVIVEITDQTNLLALNAAIEAARAGEHGRGFAVVADEVRKLASSTSEAAVCITERVEGIQKDTEEAVGAMAVSLDKVRLGVELSGMAGDSLQRIVESVAVLKEMTEEIAAATVDLAKASDEINADFMRVERSAQDTVHSAATIASESDNLSLMSAQLKDEISRYTYHKGDATSASPAVSHDLNRMNRNKNGSMKIGSLSGGLMPAA